MQTQLLRRLSRRAFRSLVVLTILVGVHFVTALVIVQIVRHNKGLRAKVLKPYNAVILPIAGRRFSPYALLKHTGRRSGRDYVTPLGAFPFGDGFVLPLAYGADVDWCRNIMASGQAILKWHGREYVLERPELFPIDATVQAYPLLLRPFITRGANAEPRQCLWLHRPDEGSAHAASQQG